MVLGIVVINEAALEVNDVFKDVQGLNYIVKILGQ